MTRRKLTSLEIYTVPYKIIHLKLQPSDFNLHFIPPRKLKKFKWFEAVLSPYMGHTRFEFELNNKHSSTFFTFSSLYELSLFRLLNKIYFDHIFCR